MTLRRNDILEGAAYRNDAGGLFRVLIKSGQKLTVRNPDGKVTEMSLGRFAVHMTSFANGEKDKQ